MKPICKKRLMKSTKTNNVKDAVKAVKKGVRNAGNNLLAGANGEREREGYITYGDPDETEEEEEDEEEDEEEVEDIEGIIKDSIEEIKKKEKYPDAPTSGIFEGALDIESLAVTIRDEPQNFIRDLLDDVLEIQIKFINEVLKEVSPKEPWSIEIFHTDYIWVHEFVKILVDRLPILKGQPDLDLFKKIDQTMATITAYLTSTKKRIEHSGKISPEKWITVEVDVWNWFADEIPKNNYAIVKEEKKVKKLYTESDEEKEKDKKEREEFVYPRKIIEDRLIKEIKKQHQIPEETSQDEYIKRLQKSIEEQPLEKLKQRALNNLNRTRRGLKSEKRKLKKGQFPETFEELEDVIGTKNIFPFSEPEENIVAIVQYTVWNNYPEKIWDSVKTTVEELRNIRPYIGNWFANSYRESPPNLNYNINSDSQIFNQLLDFLGISTARAVKINYLDAKSVTGLKRPGFKLYRREIL